MKLYLTIRSNVYDTKKIECVCGDDTMVRDLLGYIYNKYYNEFNCIPSDEELIQHFNFIKGHRKQKAQLDYKLIRFFKNFDYNIDRIKMEYIDGIGGGFGLEGFANIRINNGEPHSTPHVHVYSSGAKCVRIALNTMTQMKGDSISINKVFNKKEREILLYFLKENRDNLVNLYESVNKGELISYEYIFTLDGKKYVTYCNGKYEYDVENYSKR